MTTEKIKGLIAAPPTAFHPDGSVNLDIIPIHAAFLNANGVVGAFVNGTTGEGFSLTIEERMAIAEQWVKNAPEGLRVIVHVAHTCPKSAWEMASHAEKIGAWGIAEIAPIFFKPSRVEDLVEQASKTASYAPSLPFYFYHMPQMSGAHFLMNDFLRTADPLIPNLAGIKYTHENFVDLTLSLEYGGGKYDILHGRDETLLCALSLGCRGAVGSTYNVMAPLYIHLMDAFDAGNFEEARRLQSLSIRIINILSGTTCFFSALKETMKMLGLDMGDVREPLKKISPHEIRRLKDDLTRAGFFDICSRITD